MKYKVLSKRDLKPLNEFCKSHYGGNLPQFIYFMTDKGKLFCLNYDSLPFEGLRVEKIGFYLGEWNGKFLRLSKTGVQIYCKYNEDVELIDLDDTQFNLLISGEPIPIAKSRKFVFLSYKGVPYCWGSQKDGMILNYLPKEFRGETII